MVIVKCQRCSKEFEAKRRDARWCPGCRKTNNRVCWTAYQRRTRKPCSKCGALVHRRSTLCHICENKSRIGRYAREGNPSWKGGRTQNNGYVYILAQREGKKHRYQAEHIVIWEEANGKLPNGWVVHHLNGIRDDNRIENLSAMPRKRHNLKLAFELYEQRIQQLEAELARR